jgi:hypothetical protein
MCEQQIVCQTLNGLPGQPHNRAGAHFVPCAHQRPQTPNSICEGRMTHLRVEFGIARLVFQDIARGTLVSEENVFLFTLVSQAEQKLNDSAEHRANFGQDVSYDLRRLSHFASLQKHDIDTRLFNSRGCLKDLWLTQFEDGVSTRVVAAHRAEFAIDPAKIRNLHQPAHDDTVAENDPPRMPGGGK